MIITINQKKLKEALAITEKVVSRNLALPILQNIILKTENGRVKISSTNLEIGVNFWIGAKTEEEGEIAMPARIFSDFINNTMSEKITMHTKENIAFINAENYKTKIVGFSAKDFPIIPKNKDESFSSMDSSVLKNILGAVIESVSLSETRPELTGVFLKFIPGLVEGAATDSFRLAEKTVHYEGQAERHMIIPKATAQELIRALSEEGRVTMATSENQIFFTNEDLEIVSRLIDGHYPDYKKIIPDKYLSKLIVSKEELEKSVRLASIFTSHIADIKLHIDKEGLKISAKNADKGEVTLSVKSIVKGNPFKIAVNFRYLLDGLKQIHTEQVEIDFTGEGSPLVIYPDGKKDFTYLIMPLRN